MPKIYRKRQPTELEIARATQRVLKKNAKRKEAARDYQFEFRRLHRGLRLTKPQRELLTMMVKAEEELRWDDAEIVCLGWHCVIGGHVTKGKSVRGLLSWCAVKERAEAGGIKRYTISSVGRAGLEDESVIGRIKRAMEEGIEVDARGNPV